MRDGANDSGRNKFLLVLAAFAAPVVLSYLLYYVWPPRGAAVNYGELIQPVPLAPELVLATADGKPVPMTALRGKWLLVVAAPSTCDAVCDRQFQALRKVRLLQGREQDRVRLVWLITDGDPPNPATVAALPEFTLLRDPRQALLPLLPADRSPTQHLYVIDPLGNVMMRYGLDPDLKRMSKDLARLLRASQIG